MKLTVTKISLGGNPTRFGGICLAFLRCVFSNLEVVGGMAIEAVAFHPIPPVHLLPMFVWARGQQHLKIRATRTKTTVETREVRKKPWGIHFLTASLSRSWGENQDDDHHRPCCRPGSSAYSHIKGIIIMQR